MGTAAIAEFRRFVGKPARPAQPPRVSFAPPPPFRTLVALSTHVLAEEDQWTMDNSPTALFDSYEQDFQQLIASIRDKLEGDAKDERGGKCLYPSVRRSHVVGV